MKTKTEEPLRGEKLLKAAINKIISDPSSWDQRSWHCDTKHCLFGHCQILGGLPINSESCKKDVQKLLGISESDANWLAAPNRALSQMYHFAENYNRAGYNRAGYDSDGYNSDGYNSDGYNSDGYNSDGYNSDGYDRAGKKLPLFEI